LSNHKWQIGPVKLVNGEDAFIDAINEEQDVYRYTGRVRARGRWEVGGWSSAGHRMYAPIDSDYNLAPPPKKKVRVLRWLMVWPNGGITVYFLKDEAIDNTKKHGFALIEIDREVEEGEGL
jgi:hypothetical protein